jgi:prepilin-type N-terminal cleavage/methylation domain-containing protein
MRGHAKNRASGFTLLEVLITIVILFVVMDAVMLFFLNVMGEFRRQSKVTETGVETVIGLEIMRKDIEGAGYGLPWNALPSYSEATGLTDANDTSGTAPRAIVNVDGGGLNGSDVLVVKSVSVGTDNACRKWTTLQSGDVKRVWNDTLLDFLPTDQVLVIGTGVDASIQRRYMGTAAFNATAGLAPSAQSVRLVHGLTDGATPRMPFNRAEYFIDTTNVPALCAPGTGVLVKSVIVNSTAGGGGGRGELLPLLDCVLDFQVAFGINTVGTGATVDSVVGVTDNTAEQLRLRLRDVRISVLAQEGAKDDRYTHPEATVFVGDNTTGGAVGASDDLSTLRNYRWKVHTIVVRPSSMR